MDVEVRRERNKVMDLDFMMGRKNQRSPGTSMFRKRGHKFH